MKLVDFTNLETEIKNSVRESKNRCYRFIKQVKPRHTISYLTSASLILIINVT